MRKLAMLTIVPILLGCGEDGPLAPRYETVLRIEGTVRSAADSTPINGALVTVKRNVSDCWDWVCEPDPPRTPYPTDTDATDENGAYSLQITVGHETVECSMTGYSLRALAYGHRTGPPEGGVLKCVETLQTYDFWLCPRGDLDCRSW